MKSICIASLLFALSTSCTYNISMVHTEGQASDVIDDTNANTPNISPNISATSIPGTL